MTRQMLLATVGMAVVLGVGVGRPSRAAAQDATASSPNATRDASTPPPSGPTTPAAKATSGPTATLSEIVVTAQKRVQNLQNVPVAVTAVSAATIAQKRIENFQDLTRVAPSLTLTEGATSINNSIVLRGIGTSSPSPSVESSVAVIVDDVAVVNQAQAFTGLADVEQIEVLRGPQGTLFGRNASAGAINITTASPSSSMTGSLVGSLASDRDVRTTASLSAPITDTLKFRASGYYESRPGYIKNIANGTYSNSLESYGGRIKLIWHPLERFTGQLVIDYSDESQNGVSYTYRYVQPGARVLNLVPIDLSGQTPGLGNYTINLDQNGPMESHQILGSLRLSYDLGFAQLVSVTAAQDYYVNYVNDFDNSALNVLNPYTKGALNGGVVQQGPYRTKDLSQELRLVSSLPGPISYLLGGYFSESEVERSFVRGPAYAISGWSSLSTDRIEAFFAQGDYRFTSSTRLTAGLRVNNDHIGIHYDNYIPGGTCVIQCDGAHSDTAITWKASLQQDLTHGVMTYVSAATGYKGYGFDVGTGFTPFKAANPVKPEKSKAYEIGLKSRFFENRLQLNVAGFLTDYDNLQATSIVLNTTTSPPSFVNLLSNVGRVETKGIEVESSARPLDWLHLDASVAYVDATITSFPYALCYAGQAASDPADCKRGVVPGTGIASFTQNLAGKDLPNAPKFKATFGVVADYNLGGMPGTIGLDYRYQTDVHFDLYNSPLSLQKGYGIFNLNAGLIRGNVSMKVFINNVFDKHYAVFLTDAYSSFGNFHVVEQNLSRDSQRYAGVSLGYKY